MISYVIAIGLQNMFYLETDMIMRSNVALCSNAAFSYIQNNYIWGLDQNQQWLLMNDFDLFALLHVN